MRSLYGPPSLVCRCLMPLVFAKFARGQSRGAHLRLPVLAGIALLVCSAAAADEFEAPRVTLSDVNWAEAAASLSDHGIDPPAAEFAHLNAQTGKRFAGIAKSPVPVLLPIDIDAFRADLAAGKPEALTSNKYFGNFRPSKIFLAGPAGYFATFFIDTDALHLQLHQEADRDHHHRRRLRLRSRRPRQTGSVPGEGPGSHLPRHPAHPARSACALRLRALRRALCGVDPVLRPSALAPVPLLPAGRSDRAQVPSAVAHRRRHAAADRATAYRSEPAAGEIRLQLFQPGLPHSQHRLAQAAGPRRLSRLCRHALSDRQCAGLCEVTVLHALGQLLPHRPQRPARQEERVIQLQGERPAAGVQRSGAGEFQLSLARQFLRAARLPGRPMSGRLRPPGRGHPTRHLPARQRGRRPLRALSGHGRRRARRADLAQSRQPRRLYPGQYAETISCASATCT